MRASLLGQSTANQGPSEPPPPASWMQVQTLARRSILVSPGP